MGFACFDLETHRFSPGNMAPRIVCGGVRESHDTKARFVLAEEFKEWLVPQLKDPNVVFTNMEIAYDFACVINQWPELEDLIWDTYLADRVICPGLLARLLDLGTIGHISGSYSLAALTHKLLHYGLDKTTYRLGYAQLDGVPLEEWPQGAIDYAVDDVDAAWDVTMKLIAMAKSAGLPLADLTRQTTSQLWLRLMSNHGFRVDGVYADMLDAEVQRMLTESQGVLVSAGFAEWKKDGTFKAHKKKMGEYAEEYERSSGVRFPRTDKGSLSLGKEALPLMQNDDNLRAWAICSRARAMVAEVETLKDHADNDRRLHVRFNAMVNTGRTSSGGGDTRINIQNRGRGYGRREWATADPGMVIVSIDGDQIELRALAEVCYDLFGHSSLGDALVAGKCPYSVLASQMLGQTYDEFRERYLSGGEAEKDARKNAKAVVLGLPGGLGEATAVAYAAGAGANLPATMWQMRGGVAIPEDHMPWSFFLDRLPEGVARRAMNSRRKVNGEWRKVVYRRDEDPPNRFRVPRGWVEETFGKLNPDDGSFYHRRSQWFVAYPEMKQYFSSVNEELKLNDDRLVQPKSGRWRANCTYSSGCNTRFQGLTADGMKYAGAHLMRYLRQNGGSMLAFIHDEFLIQVPEDRLTEMAYKAKDIICERFSEWTPRVPLTAEPAAMRRWTKDAMTHVVGGKLIPHEDYLLARGDISDDYRKDLLAHRGRYGYKPLL